MKERPILFRSDMVRAILDGRKTQTRRVIKPQPNVDDVLRKRIEVGLQLKCPFGMLGDKLWVRETHAVVPASAYAMSTDDGNTQIPHRVSPDGYYRAVYKENWSRVRPGRWKPSIHMPRWASRITLEITDIRVERVQDISEVDAKAEGCEPTIPPEYWGGATHKYRRSFCLLWDSIYADRGYGWDKNPWIWCVSFRRGD